jgi:Tol biopolymer transport system component/DNA-binding winged helix-turn-helix (wHTH) protein
MSHVVKRLIDFGPFTFDFSQHVLLRGGDLIDLPSRTATVLEYLIENRERLISMEELKNQLWPNVHVERNTIDQHISKIRVALGDSPRTSHFIKTKYNRGWQFVASVTERMEVDAAGSLDSSVAEPRETTPAPSPAEAVEHPSDRTAATAPLGSPIAGNDRRSRMVLTLFLMLTVIAGLALAIRETPKQEARVVNSLQLTNDGKPKDGPLLTDGRHIFFVEDTMGGSIQALSIPVSGGEAARLNVPLSNFRLEDISRDGSRLLLRSDGVGEAKLWTYSISSRSLRPLATGYTHAAWSPDGRALAASSVGGSSIQVLGGPLTSKTELSGRVLDLKWAPDGKKLRFSLLDPRQASSSEWQIAEGNGSPQRLASISEGQEFAGFGSWSVDGKYFFYEAGTGAHQDVWVLREGGRFLPLGTRRPLRLTTGEPGSWRWPTPASDPSTLFVMNDFVRSELVRFDKSTSSWQPEWDGAAAFELDYSRDSKWAAYTHLPNHTIWKARLDGSERVQLTDAGIEAHQPHWSPDGARIAFMGRNAKGLWRVFQVPAKGGQPEELMPSGEDQGVPTWSADGGLLVFGERLSAKPRAEMSIHLLDLTTRRISGMAGTKGLWSPRWSPDGRYIAAVTSDSQAIRILSWPGTRWSELVRMRFVDNATWSMDSRYVYFNGKDEAGRWQLFRLAVPEGRLESTADLTDFPAAPENWYGVAPDGTPLAFRGVAAHEIYALKCILP